MILEGKSEREIAEELRIVQTTLNYRKNKLFLKIKKDLKRDKNPLFDSFEISKVLIVEPLRVARDTCSEEIKKWSHLDIIQYSIAVVSEKERTKAL